MTRLSNVHKNLPIKYVISGTQNITSGGSDQIINFDSKIYDDKSLVTTGASWKYVPKYNGKIHITVAISYNGSDQWDVGEISFLSVYKNGNKDVFIDGWEKDTSGANAQSLILVGSVDLDVNVEDEIDIRIRQTSGATQTLEPDTYVCIHEI